MAALLSVSLTLRPALHKGSDRKTSELSFFPWQPEPADGGLGQIDGNRHVCRYFAAHRYYLDQYS